MTKGVISGGVATNTGESLLESVTTTGMYVSAFRDTVGNVTGQGILWMAIDY